MNLTLVIIHQNNRILLGMKKRGFGVGWWNGFGGKVKPGETIADAALRETQEEAGITPEQLRLHGILTFISPNDEDMIGFIYRAESFQGKPLESEEMEPRWFPVDAIPFETMWPDDIHWMPLFLQKKFFTGVFHFTADNKIDSFALHEVSESALAKDYQKKMLQ